MVVRIGGAAARTKQRLPMSRREIVHRRQRMHQYADGCALLAMPEI